MTTHERRKIAKTMIKWGITVKKAKDTVEMPLGIKKVRIYNVPKNGAYHKSLVSFNLFPPS